MGVAIDVQQMRRIDGGIDLGGTEAGMAQQFLQRTQIGPTRQQMRRKAVAKRVRGRSEEHTSELQSLMRISSAVFCLKKKHQHSDTSRKSHTLHTFYYFPPHITAGFLQPSHTCVALVIR